MTIKETHQSFCVSLQTIYDEGEAVSIARIVFEDAFGISNFTRLDDFDYADRLNRILERLLKHEPVQYILGEADFYGLKFKVDPAVLIPRQETEELVYWILENVEEHAQVLDIGTGSGCIPISLKHKKTSLRLSAVDVSESALDIAKENAKRNNCAVDFQLINILEKEEWTKLSKYDIIVSNPPYIPHKEQHLMPEGVKKYEPALALFVENNEALIFYDIISDFAIQHLHPNGQLFFELNEFNAKEVAALLNAKGFSCIVQKDMSGKERMLKATRLSKNK